MTNLKTYGLTIDDKHTYRDFGLIMTERVVSAPDPQYKYVTVPSRSGQIDLTEVVTGSVKYNERTIEATFYSDKKPLEWTLFISELQNAYQGKKVKIIFDDDMDYYWTGRVSFALETNGRIAYIKLKAVIDPYKYSTTSTMDEWLWDTFDFEYGIIQELMDLEVNGSLNVTIDGLAKPTPLRVISNAEMSVTYEGKSYPIHAGNHLVRDVIIHDGVNTMTFVGNGVISIDYVGGKL